MDKLLTQKYYRYSAFRNTMIVGQTLNCLMKEIAMLVVAYYIGIILYVGIFLFLSGLFSEIEHHKSIKRWDSEGETEETYINKMIRITSGFICDWTNYAAYVSLIIGIYFYIVK